MRVSEKNQDSGCDGVHSALVARNSDPNFVTDLFAERVHLTLHCLGGQLRHSGRAIIGDLRGSIREKRQQAGA